MYMHFKIYFCLIWVPASERYFDNTIPGPWALGPARVSVFGVDDTAADPEDGPPFAAGVAPKSKSAKGSGFGG